MPYSLQMLRTLMQVHPDRAEPLRRHVEALEVSIESQPAFCLQNVRTLFEAAHLTIAPQLGVTFGKHGGFPDRMRGVIEALDFTISDHPEAAKINTTISALLKGIDDVTVALAQLSNIPNMRHGGSLDWGTLERQHAVMLGGLCDTLVSFLFDVAWSRVSPKEVEQEPSRYEDFYAFNAWLDETYGNIEIAGSAFPPSRILYLLDATQYSVARLEWEAEQSGAEVDQEEAA
ncbi:abortive infection family protein [Roseomonas mucosa]|uniref:abortive infection family protein n=1 Tax=Roseomonas mucosa TaxID=207340 RepID=UPI001EF687DF|nr:abortive infection family protein [Roseomonas mucosa]MCG7354112.1 abortive infection family protein [Roseomonas mucosa]